MAKCEQQAAYRYTWPGHDESYICEEHSKKLLAVAGAMGMYIQLIPLDADDSAKVCAQQ